jgi:hypothetical protein
MSTRFNHSFGRSNGNILSTFFHAAVNAAPIAITVILKLSEENDEDDDYVDPTPEEILDWMYADEDSRPEEDQYGD